MSRMQILVQRPKRTLAALATVLVAVGLTTASGANFNAQSANAANTFTAGSLTMDNSLPGAAILTASNMRPADPATVGTVDIKNTGTLSGVFKLSKGTLSDSDSGFPMSAMLDATITDCGVTLTVTDPVCGDGDDQNVYTGTIAAMGTNLPLGTYVAGARHRYKFSVALNGSANNNYQSDSSTVQFVWDAS